MQWRPLRINPRGSGKHKEHYDMLDYEQQLESGERAFKRAGNTLSKILSKEDKHITGEEALLIYNTYGLQPRDVIILFYSHGFTVDSDEFCILLKEQNERRKTVRPVNGN